ncbi:hypothetical protein PsorP6_016308 [Peronosclerospora sorghi]|uniref:Uncharacterized protein n=1 Tax=Peronosclerospora sorghi TaxID=230839 RepID=A0ACC0VLT4_9STRA|nr:hypothetical protein PsorP6_016308 [Peronosclerospora sorghi]
MTFGRDDFTTYEPLVTTICISSADGGSMRAIGDGFVQFQALNGTKVTLTGVLHVPNIARRLISVPSLTDKGVTVVFRHKVCEISFRGEKLMEVARMEKLNATVAETENEVHDSQELMNAEEERKTELWHARLGHVASSRLEIIVKVCDGVPKKLVAEMMEVDEDARGNMEVDEEGYECSDYTKQYRSEFTTCGYSKYCAAANSLTIASGKTPTATTTDRAAATRV